MLCGLSQRYPECKEPKTLSGTQLHENQNVTRQASHDITCTSTKKVPANPNYVQPHHNSRMVHTMKLVGEQVSSNGAIMDQKKTKRKTRKLKPKRYRAKSHILICSNICFCRFFNVKCVLRTWIR